MIVVLLEQRHLCLVNVFLGLERPSTETACTRTPHRRPARAADDFVCCGSASTSGHVVPAPSQITSTWSPASLNALAECLALAGEVDRARQVFDRVGARANDVGLLSEQVDTASGQLLSNFPQTFSHAGLINRPGPSSKQHPNTCTTRRAPMTRMLRSRRPVAAPSFVQADVTDEGQVERLFDEAVAAFGAVHILVNNAGVDASGTQVADLSTEVFDARIKSYIYAPFWSCRRFINIRRDDGGGGKIINVTSVHDEIPRAGAADYDCGKGGLRN